MYILQNIIKPKHLNRYNLCISSIDIIYAVTSHSNHKGAMQMQFPKIMPKEKYLGMATNDQEEYIKKKVIEILEMNPNGITIPDIVDNTYFKSRQTLIKHLERFISSGRAYKIKRRNLTTYYQNGIPERKEAEFKKETSSGSMIKGKVLKNDFGTCAYLEYDDKVIKGGILIKENDLNDFNDILNKIIKVVKNDKAVN